MQASATTATLPNNTLEVLLALAMAVIVATALAMLAGSLTRRLLRSIEGERLHTAAIANATVGVVRRLMFVIGLVALIFPALDFVGVDIAVGLRDEDLARWVARTGIRVSLLLLLAFAANRFAAVVIRRAAHEVAPTSDAYGHDPSTHSASSGQAGSGSSRARPRDERRRRAETLAATFQRFVATLIWATAALIVLRELDVDITPVLTGAGILGLAVGFGAQTLVKDVISGIFIIVEDQVRVGDAAVVNGIDGDVEEINLRTIVIRNVEGVVYTIANGDIRMLANRSKDYAYAVISLNVGYDDDSDAVIAAVKAAADEVAADAGVGSGVLDPLEVFGIDDFAATHMTLRFRIKTQPLRKAEVARALRQRIKKTFDARGIRMQPPQMEVTVRKEA